MFANKTRVLLILPSDILERARVLAGRTTTKLRLTDPNSPLAAVAVSANGP